MSINRNRITIKGRGYIIEASAKTEWTARKYAAQMGCKITSNPSGKGFLIIRPTGAMGLPEEAKGTMDSGQRTVDSAEAQA